MTEIDTQKPLFPMPEVQKEERRGRPKIELNEQIQCLIRYAIRGGMSANAVGRATGIDPKTIRKYFSGSQVPEAAEIPRVLDRLREIGSELHMISEDLAAQATRSEGAK